MEESFAKYESALENLEEAKKSLEGARHELGMELRNMRMAKELPLTFIADKLGVSAPYLYDVETARRTATVSLYERYLKMMK